MVCWHIYSNQGVRFMSPFLFGCQFMLVNLLIYSKKEDMNPISWLRDVFKTNQTKKVHVS
ncbi:hypothetical protein B1A75_06400 [Geobacillus sp. LEMMY01]|nr:hypothetical protein B1A75_06400 [Geobacillus sp. LEMMY01]